MKKPRLLLFSSLCQRRVVVLLIGLACVTLAGRTYIEYSANRHQQSEVDLVAAAAAANAAATPSAGKKETPPMWTAPLEWSDSVSPNYECGEGAGLKSAVPALHGNVRYHSALFFRRGEAEARARAEAETKAAATVAKGEDAVAASSSQQRLPPGVTLATQATFGRLSALVRLVHRWRGPVSCAFLIDGERAATEREALRLLWRKDAVLREHLSLHLLIEQGGGAGVETDAKRSSGGAGPNFPINHLRNLAWDGVTTEYTFFLDVDFIVGRGQRELLTSLLVRAEAEAEAEAEPGAALLPTTPPRAFIVPAFEMGRGAVGVPETLGEVRALWISPSPFGEKRGIWPFHHRSWKRGHSLTQHMRWLAAKTPYRTESVEGCEPFVVVATRLLSRLRRGGGEVQQRAPRFDTALRGYGLNKVAWHTELRCLGAEYIVLPKVFVVHAYEHDKEAGGSGAGRQLDTSKEAKAARKRQRFERVACNVDRYNLIVKPRLEREYGEMCWE